MPKKAESEDHKYYERIKFLPMPIGTYDWLEYANPSMAWMCFREDVTTQLLPPDFCGNPYIESSKYFQLINVYYKEYQFLKWRRADMKWVGDLNQLVDNDNNHVLRGINRTIREEKEFEGNMLQQRIKYKVGEVRKHQLKSCKIYLYNVTHRAIQHLPPNKIRIDLQKQGLVNVKYIYVITGNIVANVKVKVHVAPMIGRACWKHVVVAFIMKKFEIFRSGHIGREVKTNFVRRTKIRKTSWWVPRDLEKPVQQRKKFIENHGSSTVSREPQRPNTEEIVYVDLDHVDEVVKQLHETELDSVIVVNDKIHIADVNEDGHFEVYEDPSESQTDKVTEILILKPEDVTIGHGEYTKITRLPKAKPEIDRQVFRKDVSNDKSQDKPPSSNVPENYSTLKLNSSGGSEVKYENFIFAEEADIESKTDEGHFIVRSRAPENHLVDTNGETSSDSENDEVTRVNNE